MSLEYSKILSSSQSPQDFVCQLYEARKARNSKYSKRAFARDIEFSPSLLSQYMSGEQDLTVSACHRLSVSLKLSLACRDRLLELFYRDHLGLVTEPDRVNDLRSEKIRLNLLEHLKDLSINSNYDFYSVDMSERRTIILFKGQSLQSPEVFVDSISYVLSLKMGACYFFKNEDGSYRVYAMSVAHAVGINPYIQNIQNENLKVTFDPSGLPTIHNAVMTVLGEPVHRYATISYGKQKCVIEGHFHSHHEDEDQAQYFRSEYFSKT